MPTIEADSGCASKFGDHGEIDPSIQKPTMLSTIISTAATAHGRRDGWRSPLFHKTGTSSRKTMAESGAAIMKTDSIPRGSSASTAKYQSMYQSGRGSLATRLGLGGWPSAGGPTK
ncbi:MAG TPA: hypothetical protein VKT27_02035 [Candidatus Binataceae bacterium]|nr:hypothetical protein [Candidatus Binataceae bacterium]